jgi:hypothetical protein
MVDGSPPHVAFWRATTPASQICAIVNDFERSTRCHYKGVGPHWRENAPRLNQDILAIA